MEGKLRYTDTKYGRIYTLNGQTLSDGQVCEVYFGELWIRGNVWFDETRKEWLISDIHHSVVGLAFGMKVRTKE